MSDRPQTMLPPPSCDPHRIDARHECEARPSRPALGGIQQPTPARVRDPGWGPLVLAIALVPVLLVLAYALILSHAGAQAERSDRTPSTDRDLSPSTSPVPIGRGVRESEHGAPASSRMASAPPEQSGARAGAALDQDGGVPPERVEALARICIAEAGWSTDTGDCAAIVHLLMRRAARLGLRPRTMARRYSTRHFDRSRTDARRWIADLTLARAEPDSDAPSGWPSRVPWARFRDRWLATIEHVRAVLGGHVADPCEGAADHWGAPYGADLERARRLGFVRLACGPTRNAFWRVPRRERT